MSVWRVVSDRHHGGRAQLRRGGGGIRTDMLEAGHAGCGSDRCDGLRSGGFWVWAQLASSSSSSWDGASNRGEVEVAGLGAWSWVFAVTCRTRWWVGFLGSHGQSWECDRNTRPMRQMGCDGSEMKSFPKCLRWKRPWVNCCSSHLVMRAQVQDGIRGPRRNAPVRIAIASAQVGRSIGELAVIVHRRHSWVIRGGMGY